METLLVGDLNAHFAQPCDWSEEELATEIANYSLDNHTLHSIPRRRYRGEGVWLCMMWRYGRPITGRGDYIIDTDRRDLYNVCIRELRVPTDHRMILVDLMGCGNQRNLKYL